MDANYDKADSNSDANYNNDDYLMKLFIKRDEREKELSKERLKRLHKAVAKNWKRGIKANKPRVVSLMKVKHKTVQWLWPDRIPLGKVTLFSGDPGLGKSFVSLDIAARVSSGREWPEMQDTEKEDTEKEDTETRREENEEKENADCRLKSAESKDTESGNASITSNSAICNHHSAIPGGVLLLNAEDDAGDTIRPRLEKMGANLDHIRLLTDVKRNKIANQFSITRDIDMLDRAIREMKDCKLVIIDPLASYLIGSCANSSQIRSVLDPLKKLADKRKVAIVLINHLNKRSGSAVHRASGSISIIALARAAWGFVRCKEDPTRRLMVPLKNNLAPDVTGMAYTIDDGAVNWENEPIEITADEAFASQRKLTRTPDALNRAVEWLRDRLSSGEEVLQSEIIQRGDLMGFSRRTLMRAKKILGIISKQESLGAPWYWAFSTKENITPLNNCNNLQSANVL